MGYTHGKQWTNELVTKEIIKVKDILRIDRMPSAKEIKIVTGNCGLSNKIARCGGFYKWANKLNLKIKNSETQTGKGFEEYAIKLISTRGYEIKRMPVKYPFDLLVNNNISIDVKAGKAHLISGARWHTIGINKKYATCNLYMIFALDETNNIEKMLIVPGNELKTTTMNFGTNSKYNKYINRWDYIEKYDEFYKQLA